MARCSDLVAALDDLLDPTAFSDLGPNGLQVPGAAEVTRIATGVSATRELIERAIAARAQLVLVHHGLFWDFHPTGLSPVVAERLRLLFRHDVGLAAYHLPLDAHPSHGNNALLAQALGCEHHEPFGEYRGAAIGRAGFFGDDGVEIDELRERIARVTGGEPLHQGAGRDRVRGLAIVSGAGAGLLTEAVQAGLDALLTGEPREHVMADASELGVHVFTAGHYATETFGVRRLGALLEERFGVEHVWIDVPNPV